MQVLVARLQHAVLQHSSYSAAQGTPPQHTCQAGLMHNPPHRLGESTPQASFGLPPVPLQHTWSAGQSMSALHVHACRAGRENVLGGGGGGGEAA